MTRRVLMNDPVFLTPAQAAEFLGVKLNTIYKWVQTKQIPYRKHGRLIRFFRDDLLEWSKSKEIKPYSESC